jgi:hypothetical protein
MLEGLLPVALHFLADPFDEVSESVFPFLTQLFSYVSMHRISMSSSDCKFGSIDGRRRH